MQERMSMQTQDVNVRLEEVAKLRSTLLLVEKRQEETNNDARDGAE